MNLQQPGAGSNGDSSSAALVTPLKLRGQVVGTLGLQEVECGHRWDRGTKSPWFEAVSEQVALALENARLFEETQRRAAREKIIADVTGQVWASGEIEAVMKAAVTQLGDKLRASEVVVRLGTEADLASLPKASPPGRRLASFGLYI